MDTQDVNRLQPSDAGSYVAADASIQLPLERTEASPGQTYEEVRDNEQMGRSRNRMLRQMQQVSPPASGHIQNDQIGRQAVRDTPKERTDGTDDPPPAG